MSTTTPNDIQLELNRREIEVDALRMALAEADRLMDHCDEPTAWRERWAGLLAGEHFVDANKMVQPAASPCRCGPDGCSDSACPRRPSA